MFQQDVDMNFIMKLTHSDGGVVLERSVWYNIAIKLQSVEVLGSACLGR